MLNSTTVVITSQGWSCRHKCPPRMISFGGVSTREVYHLPRLVSHSIGASYSYRGYLLLSTIRVCANSISVRAASSLQPRSRARGTPWTTSRITVFFSLCFGKHQEA